MSSALKAGPISVQNLIVTTGAISGLEKLSIGLFEAGDSVLVPTPYYPAFDKDFWNTAHVQTIEVRTVMPECLINEEILDEAFERSIANG